MSDKGVVGVSFQALLGAMAVLLIGGGIFAFTLGPATMGPLQDSVKGLLGLVEDVGSYDQIAIDSANATRIALSCTAMLHAADADDTGELDDYFEEVLSYEWNHWYGGACRVASTETPGMMRVGTTGTPRVQCDPLYTGDNPVDDPPDPSTWEPGGDCKVYNFTLPQLNRFGGTWADVITANGNPHYLMYYNSFPDHGVRSNWEARTSRISFIGVIIGATLNAAISMVMATDFGVGGAAARKIFNDVIKMIPGFTDAIRYLARLIKDSVTSRMGKESAEETTEESMSRADTAVKSFTDTAARYGTRAIFYRTSADKAYQMALEGVIKSTFEGVEGRFSREAYETTVSYFYKGTDDDISQFGFKNVDMDELASMSRDEIEHRVEFTAREIVERTDDDAVETIAEEIAENPRLLAEPLDEFGNAYLEALEMGMDPKMFFMGIEGLRRNSGEIIAQLQKGSDTFAAANHEVIEQLQKGEAYWTKSYAKEVFQRSKVWACGSQVTARVLGSNAALDALQSGGYLENEWLEGAALMSKCAAYYGGGSKRFCGDIASSTTGSVASSGSNRQLATCVVGMAAAQAFTNAMNRRIPAQSAGVNVISLKKRGPFMPETFALHPIANWYYAELWPSSSGIDGTDILTPKRRMYAVSPCETDNLDGSGSRPYMEVDHTVTSCYRSAGKAGKLDKQPGWTPLGLGADPEGGIDRVPLQIYGQYSGSYFYDQTEEGEGCAASGIPVIGGAICTAWKGIVQVFNFIIGDESDIVYTKHPFVWTRPFLTNSNEVSDDSAFASMMASGPSFYEESWHRWSGDWSALASNQSIKDDNDYYLFNQTPPGFEVKKYDAKADGRSVEEGWNINMMVEGAADPFSPSFMGYKSDKGGKTGCGTWINCLSTVNTWSEIKNLEPDDHAPDEGKTASEEIAIIRRKMARLDRLKLNQFEDAGYGEEMMKSWKAAGKAPNPSACADGPDDDSASIQPGLVANFSACEDDSGGYSGSRCYSRDYEQYWGGDIITFSEYCEKMARNTSALRTYYHGQPGNRLYYQQIGFWKETPDNVTSNIPQVYMSSAGGGTRICDGKGLWDTLTDSINPYDSNYVSEVDTLKVEFHNMDYPGGDNPNYCYKATNWQQIAEKTLLLVGAASVEMGLNSVLIGLAPGPGNVIAGFVGFVVGFGEEWMWQCISIKNSWPYHGSSGTLGFNVPACTMSLADLAGAFVNLASMLDPVAFIDYMTGKASFP